MKSIYEFLVNNHIKDSLYGINVQLMPKDFDRSTNQQYMLIFFQNPSGAINRDEREFIVKIDDLVKKNIINDKLVEFVWAVRDTYLKNSNEYNNADLCFWFSDKYHYCRFCRLKTYEKKIEYSTWKDGDNGPYALFTEKEQI